MDGGSVLVAVTGIAVSGILGPFVSNLMSGRGEQAKFARETARKNREELRDVLDDAAALLSDGPRILRQLAEQPNDTTRVAEAREWSVQVFPMRERLALRLPDNDPILAAYDQVRDATEELAKQPQDAAAVTAYETARNRFLTAARTNLSATCRSP